MLDDYFEDPEEQPLPICQTCGDECIVGYSDCIEVDEDEIYCSTYCFSQAMMKNLNARYV